MLKNKILIACLVVGAAFGTWGLVRGTNDEASQAGAGSLETGSLDDGALGDAVQGFRPIEEVVTFWRGRVESQPVDYLSRSELGRALAAQAKEQRALEGYEDAEMVFREALELNPSYEAAQLGLASALLSQHRFDEAHDIVDDLVTRDPSDLAALAVRGDANFELGDYEDARRDYEKLADTGRTGPTLSRLARLAYVDGEPKEAVELAREAQQRSNAIALRANATAFYWFQQAYFESRAGLTDDAIASLERAIEIDPENAGAKESLASISFAVGDNDRALELYQELLAEGPAPDLHGLYADLLRELGRDSEADTEEELGMALATETVDRFPAERRHLVGFYLDRDPQKALELATLDAQQRHDIWAFDTLAWAQFHVGDHEGASESIARAQRMGTRDASLAYHAASIANARGEREEARRLVDEALSLDPNFHPTEADDARALAASLS